MPNSSIDRDGFKRLLLRLGSDDVKSSLEYERLRRKLVKFFDCNGCNDAESLADEVFDRIARRPDLDELRSVPEYAIGVARKVVLESHRKQCRETPLDDQRPDAAHREADLVAQLDREATLDCLAKALSHLRAQDRLLVLEYYDDSGGKQAERRSQLAAHLGVKAGALRVRMNRLREKLERAVLDCRRGRK